MKTWEEQPRQAPASAKAPGQEQGGLLKGKCRTGGDRKDEAQEMTRRQITIRGTDLFV